jgi:phosphoribosylformylglycinamidine synthase subunit PurS
LFRAEVIVALKPVVNDPEGSTIKSALRALGFDAVESVRAGKYLQLTLDTDDRTKARTMTEAMAQQLLANAVIEEFHITLTPIDQPASARAK